MIPPATTSQAREKSVFSFFNSQNRILFWKQPAFRNWFLVNDPSNSINLKFFPWFIHSENHHQHQWKAFWKDFPDSGKRIRFFSFKKQKRPRMITINLKRKTPKKREIKMLLHGRKPPWNSISKEDRSEI